MGKLVRDRIPGLIEADGGSVTARVLDDHEYEGALRAKLLEEAAELAAASGAAVAEELADVREVLLAIAEFHDIEWTEVERVARDKLAECGGFDRGLHLDEWET